MGRTLSPTGWAALVAVVLLALALAYCAATAPGRERRKVDAAVASANAKTQTRDTAARETAADERLADARSVSDLKTELTHAVQNLPDDVPSDRRIALGCARLRNQGTDTTALPACRGSQSGAQAPADRRRPDQ